MLGVEARRHNFIYDNQTLVPARNNVDSNH